MTSHHAPFIRAIQDWVHNRYPTRQLSATDLFYAIQWANSEVPAACFVEAFEEILRNRPHFLDEGFRLSKFNFEAQKMISRYRQKRSEDPQPIEKICVSDPYQEILDRLVKCGRMTTNPVLRDELRKLYQNMRQSKHQAENAEPEWSQRADQYYRYKSHAVVDWDEGLANLCNTCFMMLADVEQKTLLELSPAEKAHLMHLGEEAEKIWRTQRLREKVASYMGFSELLLPL